FEQFVTELPTDEFYNIGELLEYSPLKHFAEQRANRASTSDVDMLYEMPPIVANRCVKLLLEATNPSEAYVWSSRIQRHAKDFSADQQRRILRGIAKNNHLRNSKYYDKHYYELIHDLRETNQLSDEEFDTLLE